MLQSELEKKAQINILVPARLYQRLGEEAQARGYSRSSYAGLLLGAAWAARHGETGDRDLDAMVSAALLLTGAGLDVEAVSRALKCPEETVEKIVGAWFGFVEEGGALVA